METVNSRIPIRVIEDDSICTSQVDAQTTSTGRRDEAKNTRVGIEAFCEDLTLFDFRRAVEAQIPMSVEAEEDLKDIQDFRHLREDESAVAANFELA